MANNLSFELSEDSKSEIRNLFQGLAKEVVDEVMKNPIERKPYLNKGEAAAYIGISRTSLEKLINRGLPIVTIESKVLISKEEIHNFLKEIQQ